MLAVGNSRPVMGVGSKDSKASRAFDCLRGFVEKAALVAETLTGMSTSILAGAIMRY